jgi:Malectin domain
MECTEVTHATYMLHHRAFQDGNPLTGTELENHLHAHARLGYNFRVSKVAAVATTSGFNTMTVEVTVEQIGVAPFYYPLNLVLSCDGTLETADGVEDIIAPGDSKVFRFTRIPTDESCLDNIEMKLDSMFLYPERPMKFAQGSDGRVSFSLPPPPMESQEEGGNDPEIEDPFVDGEPSIEDNQKANAEEGNGDETDPVISTKIFVNAGTEDEDTSIVTGSFWINFDNSIKITNAGSYGEDVFKTHRWGESFTYTFSNLEPGSLKEVTLGFAETYEPVCVEGARVMEIAINNQVFIEELDVFANAGCNAAYVAVGIALVNGEGVIDITFLGLTENAMVSFIAINPFAGR